MPKVPRRKQTPRAQKFYRKKTENPQLDENGKHAPATESEAAEPSGVIGHSGQLQKFLDWSEKNGIVLNEKVICCGETGGVSANYGMMAADDIKAGENIFILPRSTALTPDNCSISDFIQENSDRLKSNSGWLPLILALMYEKLNPTSKWRGYLDTFPNFDDMELPMFWPLSELDRQLKGTGMVQSVATDIKNMRKEFEEILLPLIIENPQLFKDKKFKDFQFAKQISAFIMAYSFTDDVSIKQDSEDSDDDDDLSTPATIMVPMADLLNHVPEHNAELNLGESTFRMIAARDISKGEEIYNTYGKVSNYTLLLMYGFSVRPQDNPHNTVELRLSTVKEACRATEFPHAALRLELIERTVAAECADYDGTNIHAPSVQGYINNQSICLHNTGLTDTSAILKCLRLSKEEAEAKLTSLKRSEEEGGDDGGSEEGWMSDDEEDDELSNDSVRKLDNTTKVMLSRVADMMLADLPTTTADFDEPHLSKKELYSKYVRDGQITQLRNLKQLLTWYD